MNNMHQFKSMCPGFIQVHLKFQLVTVYNSGVLGYN